MATAYVTLNCMKVIARNGRFLTDNSLKGLYGRYIHDGVLPLLLLCPLRALGAHTDFVVMVIEANLYVALFHM